MEVLWDDRLLEYISLQHGLFAVIYLSQFLFC